MNRRKNIFRSGSSIKRSPFLSARHLRKYKSAEEIGADILQIHGTLAQEICKKAGIRSGGQSISNPDQNFFAKKKNCFTIISRGSWWTVRSTEAEKTLTEYKRGTAVSKRTVCGQSIYSGGWLKDENVKTGISIFAPDIVDVSSGVENDNGIGKNRDKIMEFVRKVKEHE